MNGNTIKQTNEQFDKTDKLKKKRMNERKKEREEREEVRMKFSSERWYDRQVRQ